MISSAIALFLLRRLPFSRFSFPRWKSVLAVTLVAVIYAVVPDMGSAHEGYCEPRGAVWRSVVMAIITQWASFFSVYILLCWWLRRHDFWDGRGDYFNLLATSWLVADLVAVYLPVFGVDAEWIIALLGLYSFVVTINATKGAIRQLRLSYITAGVGLSIVFMVLMGGAVFEEVSELLPGEGDGSIWGEQSADGEALCPDCEDDAWPLPAARVVHI